MRIGPTWCLVFLLAACGARSELGETHRDPEPVDAGVTPAPSILDAWWFNTIRAVCDSIAIEFCDADTVAIRYSFDDGCYGDRPTTDEPILASVRWSSETEFEILMEPEAGAPGPFLFRFHAAASGDPREDQLEWVASESTWWQPGQRESSRDVSDRFREQVESFVYCP